MNGWAFTFWPPVLISVSSVLLFRLYIVPVRKDPEGGRRKRGIEVGPNRVEERMEEQ